MALFEPRSFRIELDSATVPAGGVLTGTIVAERAMTVSSFMMQLQQFGPRYGGFDDVFTTELLVSGAMGRNEPLRFAFQIPRAVPPSVSVRGVEVRWELGVAKGIGGMRLMKMVEIEVQPPQELPDHDLSNDPEVQRVLARWRKFNPESRRPTRPQSPKIEGPVICCQGERAQFKISAIPSPVRVGLICETFLPVSAGESTRVERNIVHEEWQELRTSGSGEFIIPADGRPSFATPSAGLHWELRVAESDGTVLAARPICVLSAPGGRVLNIASNPETSSPR